MEKGVKKIGYVRGPVFESKSVRGKSWVIPADQYVYFGVLEWYPGTTDADKKKDITWIRQTSDRKTIKNQMLLAQDKVYGVQFQKKLCGNFMYYIEASLSGNRDRRDVGLFVKGWCEKRIISSKWSKTSGGANIKNQLGQVKYGNIVHLNLQTEGLNNYDLIVEIYNRIGLNRDDKMVAVITGVKVTDGEVDLQIGNTFAWMAKIRNISAVEDFYIKVKDPTTNQYVVDNLKQDLHAVYLKINNEVATTAISPTRNNKVAKVGQAQSNHIAYDDCKFNKIELTEIIQEDGISKPQTAVLFSEGASGATTRTYNVVAPDQSIGKELTLVVGRFETEKCKTGKHKSKEIIFREVGVQEGSDDKRTTVRGQDTIKQKVYCNITRLDAITYIWAKATRPNQFWYYINSCRYYNEPIRPTVIVNAYPDIKWELAFEFQVAISNYKAANMPAGNVYRRHQEIAMQEGYKRWYLNQHGKFPINMGVGLAAEWNNKRTRVSYTDEFEGKFKPLAEKIAGIIETLQKAINFAQSVAKETSIPVAFNIRYPKLTIAASWYLESTEVNRPIAVVGEISAGAKPLIGAQAEIDILGCAISALSYGTTGNPAAARLIDKFRGGLERLGASVTFTATFYGELELSVDAVKIHSINGVQGNGKTTIGGKMGATILLAIEVGGKIEHSRFSEIIPFKASASLQGDSYFGGEFTFDSDRDGTFVVPLLKFSGVKVTGEVKGEIGWWKSSFKLEEVVIEEQTYTVGKYYFI